MDNKLIHFNKAKQELALATEIDEVKEIRDKAEALRAYAKQAGESLGMQNQCAEIKIRAERRAGELIPEQIKHGGDRKTESRLQDATLKNIGIDKTESHRFQQVASIPEEKFEEHITNVKDKKKELTSIGVQKLAKELQREERDKNLVTKPLPEGLYEVIFADPPWKYDFSVDKSDEIEVHYPTMDLEDIKNIKVPATDSSVLFLWVTAPKLLEGLEVLKSWGFEYKTNAIWDKKWFGMGYWFRGQHELLLVGVKGNFSPPKKENRFSSVISEKRTKHSKKPNIVYDMIEKMFPNKKKLELFARQKYNDSWEVWGNEIL